MKLAYAISTSATRFHAVASGPDVAATIRGLAALEFEGVELAIRDPAAVDVDALIALTVELGLKVPAIGTGQAFLDEGLCLASPDPAVRARTVDRLLAQVGTARRLEALVIIGLIHGPLLPGEDRETAADRLLAGLETVARAAAAAGVRLVIEPINRYETNWLNTMSEVLDLIARLDADNIGVLPDTFHMNIEEAGIADALRSGRDRIWHVHVADSNRRAPGWGHFDFAPLVQVLREIGYRGFLSAEILPEPAVHDAARQTAGVMRPLVPRA